MERDARARVRACGPRPPRRIGGRGGRARVRGSKKGG